MAVTTLLDLAMIICARIIAPRAAVALQEQRRMVGSALGRRFQPAASCTVIGTE